MTDTYGSEEVKRQPEEKSRSNVQLPMAKQREENLRALIAQHPKGVAVTKLPRLYEVKLKFIF